TSFSRDWSSDVCSSDLYDGAAHTHAGVVPLLVAEQAFTHQTKCGSERHGDRRRAKGRRSYPAPTPRCSNPAISRPGNGHPPGYFWSHASPSSRPFGPVPCTHPARRAGAAAAAAARHHAQPGARRGLRELQDTLLRLDAGRGQVQREPGVLYLAHPHHRSEEHTSELQSRENLVCRLLLER